MQTRLIFTLFFALILSACGNPSPEKALIGTWVQETPTSTTQSGLQATTSDTVLMFEKDGDASLRRLLDLRGAGLPETGVSVDVDLSGQWILRDNILSQTLENALITPRTTDPISAEVARQLQVQAETNSDSQKIILVLDRKQLILQDSKTEVTDVYRRK